MQVHKTSLLVHTTVSKVAAVCVDDCRIGISLINGTTSIFLAASQCLCVLTHKISFNLTNQFESPHFVSNR